MRLADGALLPLMLSCCDDDILGFHRSSLPDFMIFSAKYWLAVKSPRPDGADDAACPAGW